MELTHLSGMKMLPEQEVQAGSLPLWTLIRQASTASIGFAIHESDALCDINAIAGLYCELCNTMHLQKSAEISGPGFLQRDSAARTVRDA